MKKHPILFNTEMEFIKDIGLQKATPTSKQKFRYGIYKCPICKNNFRSRTASVKNGASTKCRSCQVKIKNTTHNESKGRLYNIWARMKYRCLNKNNPAFKYYGAKGVSVCDDWLDAYENFKKWALENGYTNFLVIDKDIICERENIFPKIYSPETCLWVTKSENSIESNNRKKLKAEVYNG